MLFSVCAVSDSQTCDGAELFYCAIKKKILQLPIKVKMFWFFLTPSTVTVLFN